MIKKGDYVICREDARPFNINPLKYTTGSLYAGEKYEIVCIEDTMFKVKCKKDAFYWADKSLFEEITEKENKMFNVGDKILCIDVDNAFDISLGKIYTVQPVDKSVTEKTVYIKNDNGKINNYLANRFKLVENNQESKIKTSEIKKVKFIPETDFEFVEMDGVRGILITEKE